MADKTIQEQIADKLLEINTAKLDIKDAIESKGRDLTEVAFSGYADEIEAISGAIEQVADMDALEELTPTEGRIVEVLEGEPCEGGGIEDTLFPATSSSPSVVFMVARHSDYSAVYSPTKMQILLGTNVIHESNILEYDSNRSDTFFTFVWTPAKGTWNSAFKLKISYDYSDYIDYSTITSFNIGDTSTTITPNQAIMTGTWNSTDKTRDYSYTIGQNKIYIIIIGNND